MRQYITTALATIATLACIVSATIPAAHAEVLHDHDNSPFTGIFGLPDASEGADLLSSGVSRRDALLVVSSHSVADAAGNDVLIIDGETSRLEFVYSRGVGERWELGIEVPVVTHQAGGLDSLIDGWHDIFGLPDGSRDDRPQDVLEFLYASNNELLADFGQNTTGIGDLRLRAGYQLTASDTYYSALRLGLKLPTANAVRLLGSGGSDVSVGLAGDWRTLAGSDRLSGFYRFNLSLLGEPEYLAERYRDVVGQASAGLRYQVTRRLGLSVQGTLRSALYDADVEMLGETAGSLTFGGDLSLSDRWSLLIGVGEDILVETTPDVSFQMAFRYRPDR